MARVLARITGTAIKPGVSKNGRLYTREAIAKAVERAQQRLAEGAVPLTMLTHHEAGDDSTQIVGQLTSLTLASDGSAKYAADLADTKHGRTIAGLTDTTDGRPFLRGVSIRGAWAAPVVTKVIDGQRVESAADLELDGLDFTRKPGVEGAGVEDFAWTQGAPTESATGRVLIYESAPEALVTQVEEAATVESSTAVTDTTVEEKGAPALKSGKPAAAPTKASAYADPGYQDDKAKRYALDNKAQAKAAWSYINQPKNAKLYTANQLKRVKQRILKALEKFGVTVDAKEHWVIDSGEVTESEVTEYYGDTGMNGSFRIELNNGPVCVTVSSYCIDPADLDVIGRAAMGAACDSLKSLDPDMDGDIDVDGAPSEDTDNSMESAPDSTPDTAVVAETETAPSMAADPTTETEALVADETTTPAVEPSADATPKVDGPAVVSFTQDQFAALLAAVRPAEPALAGAAAEAAPVDKAETSESAPAAPVVTESDEDRIARLVAEGVAKALPTAIQEHVEKTGPQRKGLVKPVGVTESADDGVEYPESWPVHAASGLRKAPHEMTADEFDGLAGPLLLDHITGGRFRTD